MANLKSLTIGSSSPRYFPDRESRYPPTRTFLPALIHFELRGVSRYLEDLLARIDAHLLDSFFITFLHETIFNLPQLVQFMKRTTKFRALNEAHVYIDDLVVRVESLSPTETFNEMPGFTISCERNGCIWPYISTAEVLTSFFPSIYIVEHLYLYGSRYFMDGWTYGSEIFRPFSFVKNIYISKEFARGMAHALRGLVEEALGGATDVLPALETLFLEEPKLLGPVRDVIGQFVAARQLLGHPITIYDWNKT